MKKAADLLSDSRTSRRWGLIVFALFALPALAAIWFVPFFVSQDGPLHLQCTLTRAACASIAPIVGALGVMLR